MYISEQDQIGILRCLPTNTIPATRDIHLTLFQLWVNVWCFLEPPIPWSICPMQSLADSLIVWPCIALQGHLLSNNTSNSRNTPCRPNVVFMLARSTFRVYHCLLGRNLAITLHVSLFHVCCIHLILS